MLDRTIPPDLARMMVGDADAMVGAGKLVFSDYDDRTGFGGVVKPPFSTPPNGNWQLSVGTLIWVPMKNHVATPAIEGWSIEDILTGGGLDVGQYWKEAADDAE